jgi:hypothetical protein
VGIARSADHGTPQERPGVKGVVTRPPFENTFRKVKSIGKSNNYIEKPRENKVSQIDLRKE